MKETERLEARRKDLKAENDRRLEEVNEKMDTSIARYNGKEQPNT